MIVIRVSGRVRHIRPLPSDSTTDSVPVSATPKLAPLMPTLADRNLRRRCCRAAPASAAGSSVSPASTSPISARKISRISARLRWIAGTRMCDGLSWPSCTISSARSVSSAAIPPASRASLRPISWVDIDLTLTTSSTPLAWTRSNTIAFASAASRAQWTTPPRAVTACSNCARYCGRRAMVCTLSWRPASRSSSQSGTSETTCARLARIVPVAFPRLRRSCVSASARLAATGNFSSPRRLPTPRGEVGGSAGIPNITGALMRRSRRDSGRASRNPPDRRSWAGSTRMNRPSQHRLGSGMQLSVLPAAGQHHWLLASRRQYLSQVDGLRPGPQPGQPAADVHEARAVTSRTDLRAGAQDVVHLVGQHRGRRVGVLDRESAAEAATLVCGGQLHQLQAIDMAQQTERLVAYPQHPQAVAGRVVRHPVREVGPDIGHVEHVDQQLRQLVRLCGDPPHACHKLRGAEPLGQHFVLMADGTDA